MMNGEVLKRLFRAVASEDSVAIQSMMSIVVEDERKKGHTNLASQLENIIRKSSSSISSSPSQTFLNPATPPLLSPNSPKFHALTPLSSKHRFNHPFIVTIPRENLRHHMILADAVEERFRRIEKEYAARDRLANFGLRYRQKIWVAT
jgi:hypothetical protein